MGFLLSKLWWSLSSERPYKVIVLGLNNAGKTSVLYSMLFGKLVPTQPTLGTNVEEFKFRNVNFCAWDLGGQELLRHSWSLFYAQTDAVIVVIDSADPARFDTIKGEMERFIVHPDLARSCVLVFANKQDIDGAVKPADLAVRLDLARLLAGHTWTIQGSSAVQQTGLNDGLGWIVDNLKS